ncbi:hypothetical protein RclHR1_07980002 [Rhizophagus clarus]|nr:hypothetical protein RclHR1_07980002 [Rhizophagus clarus]
MKEFNDIKINLPIFELLAPSKQSRAKKEPRPQNQFILYRKNISKELRRPVGKSSEVASSSWKKISEREKEFWKQLAVIAKEKHTSIFPEYKYTPNKKKKRKQSTRKSKKEAPQIIMTTPSDISSAIKKNEQFSSANQELAHHISPSVNPNLTPQQIQQPQQLPQQPQLIDPYYYSVELPHYFQPFAIMPTLPITHTHLQQISHPQFVITSPAVSNEFYNSSYESVDPDPFLLNLLDDNYNYYYEF